MRKQEGYWAFKAPDTPEFSELPDGTFAGTEAGWDSLPPGYRREIYRSAIKKASPPIEATVEEDIRRIERANLKHDHAAAAIKARETL